MLGKLLWGRVQPRVKMQRWQMAQVLKARPEAPHAHPVISQTPKICLGAHPGTVRARPGHGEGRGARHPGGAWLLALLPGCVGGFPDASAARLLDREASSLFQLPEWKTTSAHGPGPGGASPALHPVGLAGWPGRSSCPGATGAMLPRWKLKGLLVAVVCRLAASLRPQLPPVRVLLASRKTPGTQEAPLGTGRTRETRRGRPGWPEVHRTPAILGLQSQEGPPGDTPLSWPQAKYRSQRCRLT